MGIICVVCNSCTHGRLYDADQLRRVDMLQLENHKVQVEKYMPRNTTWHPHVTESSGSGIHAMYSNIFYNTDLRRLKILGAGNKMDVLALQGIRAANTRAEHAVSEGKRAAGSVGKPSQVRADADGTGTRCGHRQP